MGDGGPVLALVGPTAAGKTALACEIAPAIGAEIVCIDSASIYRGMDVGTDKPSPAQRAAVRHHMLDEFDPAARVSVAEFQRLARRAVDDIRSRGKVPLLVGGSGLYFRAVVDALEFPPTDAGIRGRLEREAVERGPVALFERLRDVDPAAAVHIEAANVRRVIRALEVHEVTGRRFSSFRTAWDGPRAVYPHLAVAGLTRPRDQLDRAVDARVDRQIAAGLVAEVARLEEQGIRGSRTAAQALGYAQILAHLEGRLTLDEAVAEMKRRTRRFARHQLTWFRADPRVRWFESDPEGAGAFLAESCFGAAGLHRSSGPLIAEAAQAEAV